MGALIKYFQDLPSLRKRREVLVHLRLRNLDPVVTIKPVAPQHRLHYNIEPLNIRIGRMLLCNPMRLITIFQLMLEISGFFDPNTSHNHLPRVHKPRVTLGNHLINTAHQTNTLASKEEGKVVVLKTLKELGWIVNTSKCNPSPPEVVGVFRSSMGYLEQQEKPATEENSGFTNYYSEISHTTTSDASGSSRSSRDHEFCLSSCPTGSIKLPLSPETLHIYASKQCQGENSATNTSNEKTQVVEAELRQVVSPSPSTFDPLLNDRRCRDRLGSRIKRVTDTGRMVERGIQNSLESKRDVEHIEVSSPIRSSSKPFIVATLVRQQVDRFDIRLVAHHIPGKLNGVADRLSRKSIIPEWHLLPALTQVVFQKWGVPDVDLFASSCSKLRQSGSNGSSSVETQCVRLGMEVQTSVDISVSELNSKSSYASQSSGRYISNSSTEVAAGVLESGFKSSSYSTPIQNLPTRVEIDRSVDGPSSAKSRRADSRSLEMWGWSEAVESWSTQQKALLMAGWRKSTLNTYKPAWERWVKWCQSSDISPINPVGADLAQYLADLHFKHRLSYKTIYIYS
ncbi:unnamed protein product, partial [Brenthis ino]